MEPRLAPLNAELASSSAVAEAIEFQRQKVRDEAIRQEERLRELEATLTTQVDRLVQQLAIERSQTDEARVDATRLQEELALRAEELRQLEAELELRQSALDEAQREAETRLEERENALANLEQELAERCAQFEASAATLEASRAEIARGFAELDQSREENSAREAALAQRELELGERGGRLAEGEQALAARDQALSALETNLAARQAELTACESAVARREAEATARSETLERQEAELARQSERLSRLEVEFNAVREQFESQRQAAIRQQQEAEARLGRAQQALDAQRSELERQREQASADGVERQRLLDQLAAQEQEVARLRAEKENGQSSAQDAFFSAEVDALTGELAACRQELEDLRAKHAMALDDLRSQRARIAELENHSARAAASASTNLLDWESRKRMLLAALEADEAGSQPLENEQRRRIEEALRKTDEIVAEKDREIAELKRLLEEQSNQIGSLAVGAQAVAAVLDNDAIIRQTREKLAQLQREWEEKLRAAEIDMSLERARIARERAEIEEKLRDVERQLAAHSEDALAGRAESAARPPRGRWLARLGLADDDPAGG
jgi:chromosome segregation ATPase